MRESLRQLNISSCLVCVSAGNTYVDSKGMYKLPRILTAFVRGQRCFDVEFFVEHNRDFFGKAPVHKFNQEVRERSETPPACLSTSEACLAAACCSSAWRVAITLDAIIASHQ